MSSQTLIRWSGLTAIVVGAVTTILNLAYFLKLLPSTIDPPRQLVTLVLSLLAIMGIYAYQHHRAGLLGLTGFTLLLVTFILNYCVRYVFTFIAPTLINEYPEAAVAVGSQGPYLASQNVMMLSFVLGYVLFGIATLRAGLLPRYAAWLLIVGGIASFLLAGLPLAVGALLIAAAYIWIGYVLWQGEPVVLLSPQPQPAATH